jgi:hypothetical protein
VIVLLEREQQCRGIDYLLASIRGGLSAVRVLRGESGIGKTVLLDYALGNAADMPEPQESRPAVPGAGPRRPRPRARR